MFKNPHLDEVWPHKGSEPQKTLVIAGSYRQFLDWKKAHPEEKDARYASKAEDFRYQDVKIVLTGTYFDSPAFREYRRWEDRRGK